MILYKRWSSQTNWSTFQQKRGEKRLIFFPFKQKGNIKCLCDAERVPDNAPALGTSKDEWPPSEGTEQWNSPAFPGAVASLHLSSFLEGTWKPSPSLPPSLLHTSVLLPPEPVFYSLQFSIFKTVWAAEGLKSVISPQRNLILPELCWVHSRTKPAMVMKKCSSKTSSLISFEYETKG